MGVSAILSIVGRPNVGKSALFNRLAGRRIAIVHDQPGVTRDRVSAELEWRGRSFTLVDTGGLGLLAREKALDPVTQAAFEQVQIAIDSADVILLVVNVQEGVVPLDKEVAERLRRSGKTVLVAVNKADHPGSADGVGEFAELGFERLFPVSAIHGRGIDALMDAALGSLPMPPVADPQPDSEVPATDADAQIQAPASKALRLAIVGRPNVGKSSIINALTQSKRVIVSPIPGTTRDAVDVPLKIETDGRLESYVLVDTAGIRQTRHVGDSIEFFSVKRAEDTIARCDIAVLVLDAEAGISEQDKKIGGRITEENRACIIVVNKWDLFQERLRRARQEHGREPKQQRNRGGEGAMPSRLSEFGQWVQRTLFFLDYAPVIFASAHSGFNLDRLLEAVRYVASQLQQKIPTAVLNRTLHQAIEDRQPVSSSGQRLKFFYATQLKTSPPTFLLFVNKHGLMTDQYRKYLTGQLRRAFGWEGCPLVLVARSRPQSPEAEQRQAGRRNFSRAAKRRNTARR